MWKQSILPRLNATCFDVALLLTHFWSQFLTDFHKWPFVLKLRTCSFICTYSHDPIMPIMGPKRGRNRTEMGPKIVNIVDNRSIWFGGQVLQQIVFCSQACWRACSVSLLTAGVKCSHETNSFHFLLCFHTIEQFFMFRRDMLYSDMSKDLTGQSKHRVPFNNRCWHFI